VSKDTARSRGHHYPADVLFEMPPRLDTRLFDRVRTLLGSPRSASAFRFVIFAQSLKTLLVYDSTLYSSFIGGDAITSNMESSRILAEH
jgi:hypothetical protein